jgi:hypothetical protein
VNGGGWERSFNGKFESQFKGEVAIENGGGNWHTHFNHRNQGTNFIRGRTEMTNGMLVPGDQTVEFGVGVSGKEESAGKIRYGGPWGGDKLHIVGAGGNPRKVQIWDELCIDNVCINADHLRMLKGEKQVRIFANHNHNNSHGRNLRYTSDGKADFMGGAGDWERMILRMV